MADKALLVGINNYQSIGDLRGCINDTHSIQSLLINEYGFNESDIHLLSDSEVTKAALTKQWKWLIGDTKAGDRIVFHFSGHGSYSADEDGDEDDGVDELICLYDMDWSNPDSYLLDDELREWTKKIPKDVLLTVILDSCHSGTATRSIAPAPSKLTRHAGYVSPSVVDLESTLKRVPQAMGMRSAEPLGPAEVASMLKDAFPDSVHRISSQTVLARFAPPPAWVEERIIRRGKRSSFSLKSEEKKSTTRSRSTEAEMNHVLWSGSRSDQTSADAYIENEFHGAFTWTLCSILQSIGNDSTPDTIISEVRSKLRQDGFSQVPQLEPTGTSGVIFGQRKNGSSSTNSASNSSPPSNSGKKPDSTKPTNDSELGSFGPTTEQWARIASSLESIAEKLSLGLASSTLTTLKTPSNRSLVYVHGICLHDPGYSNGWWDSMQGYLDSPIRSKIQANRQEVLWSKHVTPTDRNITTAFNRERQQQVEQQLRDILQERATQEVATAIANASTNQNRGLESSTITIPRSLLGIPGLDCVDDFTKYLVSDEIRTAVLSEFISVVKPRLARGEIIDIISHSWGTVVAYEGLRNLEAFSLPGRVSNFFTVGSALAISYIKSRLRPNDGQKPKYVDQWINVDAKGDIVGGSLHAVGLAVDQEYLNLEPTGCQPAGGFLKLYSPACSHSSYFKSSNSFVNRDIFAKHINRFA